MGKRPRTRILSSHVSQIVVLFFIGDYAAAQQPSFQEAIARVADERATINSYELSVEGKVDDEARPVELTDGTISVPKQKLVGFTLDFVVDVKSNSLLVARQNRNEELTSGARSVENWHVYIERSDGAWVGRESRIVQVDKQHAERPKYFDPLGLGLAFEHEFFHGDRWPTIVNNYRKWGRLRVRPTEAGIVSYGDGDVRIDIDSTRGYWPVKLKRQSSDFAFITEVKLAQFDSHWLPHSADVQTRNMRTQLKFAWKSVNRPVDDRFDVNMIKKRYDFRD